MDQKANGSGGGPGLLFIAFTIGIIIVTLKAFSSIFRTIQRDLPHSFATDPITTTFACIVAVAFLAGFVWVVMKVREASRKVRQK